MEVSSGSVSGGLDFGTRRASAGTFSGPFSPSRTVTVFHRAAGGRAAQTSARANGVLLRRMALSRIKAEESKGSVRGQRQGATWDNDFREKILLDFTNI